jgi:high affinity Mn2+ porin
MRTLAAVLLACIAAAAVAAEESADAEHKVEAWAVHVQSTVIVQGHPRFRSPYQGANSLEPENQTRETITATGYLATRLWQGAEFYVNPEEAQGFGLSRTLGVAGFPNGEATKAGANTPKANMARYFLRQVIGLGGEQEVVKEDLNQLGSRYDVSRLTLTIGKVSANDQFDDNDFAHDPRREFLNWSLWESAAWDYPADAKGYTYGATADLNQKDWALRWGWFLMPKEANAKAMAPTFYKYFGTAVELETRHDVTGKEGKLRVLGFVNRARAGDYRQSIDESPAAPDITQTRLPRVKWGGALNLEEPLTDELGFFSRLSWNDGRAESFAFTEIDRSAALGLSLKGLRWSRPGDTVGIAAVVNGLSKPHRDYLAAGGIGFIIGDGQLAYGTERIIEAYYDALLVDGVWLALDVQHVENPGYNRDRGPVEIFALRAHFEF